MEYQEALKVVDDAIAAHEGRRLNNVEMAIFKGAWEGLTYEEIAARSDYAVNYLKGYVGHRFWKLLSDALGETITKANFKSVLEHRKPVASSFDYIDRPPIEYDCEQEILKPGALLRIQGSRNSGKTWLISRLINFASSQGFNAVHLPLRLAEKSDYKDLDSFLYWLCIGVSQLLPSEYRAEKDWWDNRQGNSKMKAMAYIEEHLLSKDKPPLVLGLDDLDSLFSHSEIANEFFSLLRSLHEKAKTRPIWEKFRLILAYREEYIHLPEHSSPFNVGTEIKLPEFNEEQVKKIVT